jgi:hypothetical protein
MERRLQRRLAQISFEVEKNDDFYSRRIFEEI